jgi:chorismate mutase
MTIRGVRGATTADGNDAAAIIERTLELLGILVERNAIVAEDLASATFTVTDDLDAEFPALAVRSLQGWEDVPLLCAREIPVPGSLGRCIRVLLHWNTGLPQGEVRHAFLRGARSLRPRWEVRVPGDENSPTVRLPSGRPSR